VDLFYDGRSFHELAAARVDTTSTHGTGCTFASAISAGLAKGSDVRDAVAMAKALRAIVHDNVSVKQAHEILKQTKDSKPKAKA